MNIERSLLAALALPLIFACSDDGGRVDEPMFTTASGTMSESDTDSTDSAGTDSSETSGDSDSNGDGDGDGTDSGDGDGDNSGSGDGDGDPTTTGPGDGDGDEPECATDPTLVGSSCGQGQAAKGPVAIGESLADLPIGQIGVVDNGIGNGAEDWYHVEFPADANLRPEGGTPTISFAVNDGGNYRFEVFRDCGDPAFSQGLASEFGAGAPPLSEWSFFDLTSPDEQADYINNVNWPDSVWIRVFRFQNDGECDTYQLQVDHL